MIDRAQVARILKLNGIDISAPADEIKSILLSANWREDDVETALTVLREDPVDHKEHVETLHKIFRSDDKLSPETISGLLGIDVDVSTQEINLRRKHARGELTAGLAIHILLISLVLSSLFIFGSMWLMKVGLFHETGPGI